MKLNNNILLFISLSLGIHLVLLLSFQSKAFLLPAATGNKLSIRIHQPVIKKQNKNQTQQKNKNTPVVNKKLAYKHTAQKQHDLKALASQENTTSLTPAAKTVTHKVFSNSQNTGAQAKIISQVKLKLRSNFYYPRLAQRRNWQGNVLLVFDINPNGLIKNVAVSKSSGYHILDNAALDSLSSVKRVNTEKNNSKHHSGLSLNIKYRLEEG